jgi:hypothetical protein
MNRLRTGSLLAVMSRTSCPRPGGSLPPPGTPASFFPQGNERREGEIDALGGTARRLNQKQPRKFHLNPEPRQGRPVRTLPGLTIKLACRDRIQNLHATRNREGGRAPVQRLVMRTAAPGPLRGH